MPLAFGEGAGDHSSMVKRLNIWTAAFALLAALGMTLMAPGDTVAQTVTLREFVVQADLEKVKAHVKARGTQTSGIEQIMSSNIGVIEARLSADQSPLYSVTDDGEGRLRIRVPANVERSSVERLLGIAADLSIRLVDDDVSPIDLEDGRAPEGYVIMLMTEGDASIAVRSVEVLNGDHIVDARPGIDLYTGEPVINIGFDSIGRERFAALTSANVGQRIAIVLDGKVLIAPFVNEPVTEGVVQISGSFTAESANELAIMLHSGALPTSVEIIEERMVELSR